MGDVGDELPALGLHLSGLGDIGEDDHRRNLVVGIEQSPHCRCDPGGHDGAGFGCEVQIQHGGDLVGDGIAHRLAEPLVVTGLCKGGVHQLLAAGEVLVGRSIALADHKALVHQQQAAIHIVQNVVGLTALLFHPLPAGRKLIGELFDPGCHPGGIALTGHGHKGVFPICRQLFQPIGQHGQIPGRLGLVTAA